MSCCFEYRTNRCFDEIDAQNAQENDEYMVICYEVHPGFDVQHPDVKRRPKDRFLNDYNPEWFIA